MNKKRYETVKTEFIHCGDTPINTIYKWCIYDKLEQRIIKEFKTKKEANTERKELYNY